jgi:hypothetical protein
MKKILFLIIIAIISSLAGCGTQSVAGYPAPVYFDSTDAIKAEKEARNSASYQEDDPQGLKSVNACYHFSKLPSDIVLSRYAVSKAYVSSSYLFRKNQDDFTSQFSELAYPDDELLKISLTAHRNYGQKEFSEFLERNSDNGKLISIGGISNVFFQEAKYKDAVIQKVYYFVYLDQYFSLSVPGNVSDDIVSDLLKTIQKVDIS